MHTLKDTGREQNRESSRAETADADAILRDTPANPSPNPDATEGNVRPAPTNLEKIRDTDDCDVQLTAVKAGQSSAEREPTDFDVRDPGCISMPTVVASSQDRSGSAAEPDPDVIRATWRWLAHDRCGVAEVRVIRPDHTVVGIGYFDDEEAFVRECIPPNDSANVYVGIQPRPARLKARAPNRIRPKTRGTKSDDIEVITALVVDLDPVRPPNTASTDAQLAQALDTANTVADWCQSEGLVRPRLMMSGNGAQLWFALPPTPLDAQNHKRLEAGLEAFEIEIRQRFESSVIHVDCTHDLPRVIKVIGTVSRKGDGLGERPHRTSVPLMGFERVEDAALLTRLDVEPAPLLRPRRAAASRKPTTTAEVASQSNTTKAKRGSDGAYDWEHPVEMCGPVRRLWEQGAEDRSLAIFDMIRFFAHKKLGLDEITELILEYDRRGLGKLANRDGVAYVRKAYEKILAGAEVGRPIAPPCHSLQKLEYCPVGQNSAVRCELYANGLKLVRGRNPWPQQDDSARESEVEGAGEHEEKDTAHDACRTSEAFDGELIEGDKRYCVVTDTGTFVAISSFTIEPKMRITCEEGEIILGDANTDIGTTIESLKLPLSAFHSKRDLMRQLTSADLQWTGTDNNVQGLLRLLAHRSVPRNPGSCMLGEYQKGDVHVWIGPNCAIGKQGFLDQAPVIYIPNGASLDKRLSYLPTDDATFQSVARVVFGCLPRLNKPEVILPIIGWYFATPMKPRLMATVGSFPSLFVWGSQGSGKSSLCIDVMWPLFGVRDAEPYSATETEFALLKILTATRSVPVFLDEYKPYDMPRQRLNTLHRYLRRLYRGETEERGRPDQKVNTYHLQAPVCIAGETRPIEAALLERIISANPDKTTLKEKNDYREAHRQLREIKLELFAPRYIQFCLGRDVQADLNVAQWTTQRLIGNRTVPVRVLENLNTMMLGIYLFLQFATACGFEFPDGLDATAAINAVLADVLETDHGVKNALDHFLEMLAAMAVQGQLRHRVHYTFSEGRLALHLESSYDAFRAHCKQINYEGEIVDLKALRRLVMENRKLEGFVVAESERVCFDGRENRRRAVLIDLTKTNVVTADDFPQRDDNDSSAADGYRSRYA